MRRFRFGLRLRLALVCAILAAVVSLLVLFVALLLVDSSIVSSVRFRPGSTIEVTLANGQSGYASADSVMAAVRSQAQQDLFVRGLLLSGFVILVGGAAGYALASRALGPIAEVTAAARRISSGAVSRLSLAERIGMGGAQDELRDLADTFDTMLERLDHAFDAQRRFVANASHELRTPLAVMRTEADVTLADPNASIEELRQMGAVIQIATDKANRLVDSLLVLARSESQAEQGLEVAEPLDLADVVPSALANVANEIAAAGLAVNLTAGLAPVTGDPRLLERMIGNLVENAIRHNSIGGWVQIVTGNDGASAVVSVANSGQQLDPSTVNDLFAPFRRAADRTAGQGTGLGLSIVRAVAAAHGGTVGATARPEGGLEVVVQIPLRPAPND